jgi:hypothetical protein
MDLSLSGSWGLALSASDLVSGAGSELPTSADSATNEVTLDVTLTGGDTDNWRLDVRQSGAFWDPALHVWVRRTGSGTGTGSIADGTTWIEVGSTDTAFFTGAGDRSTIAVQVRVTGLSLTLQPDAYLSNLQYTLVDTL